MKFCFDVSAISPARLFRIIAILATLSALWLQDANAQFDGSPETRLDELSAGWPRVHFFRSSERTAANPKMTFERWDAAFSQLMGIEGKVLDEEIPNRSERNIDFFTRFKAAHPRQIALLHYNGIARDPLDARSVLADGHWLYFNGATVNSDLSAQPGEMDIAVSDARLFKTNIGRYKNSNEDIGLCEIGADGKPDWSKAEQVQLLTVQIQRGGAGILRVRRAQFRTQARAFANGRTYAAPHVTNGPWGQQSPMLWFYNLSTTCPRDGQGRTCSEVLTAELGAHFSPTGPLAVFDGLQFDVLRHSFEERAAARDRSADADADGKADGGFVNGDDVYGAGTLAFCAHLRKTLGKDRLILVDGWNRNHPRAFSSLNGMESEGWPKLGDYLFADWSGGMNRGMWWNTRSASPTFNYINHKALGDNPAAGQPKSLETAVDYPYNRLVFAAAVLMDHALCSSLEAPMNEGELTGVWDEFRGGTQEQLGWLGMPRGAVRRLGFDSPDLLDNTDLLRRITTDNAIISEQDGLVIQGKDAAQELTSIQLTVPVGANGELLVRFTVSALPSARVAGKAPRLFLAGTTENRDDLHVSWSDESEIEYTCYATNLPAGEARVTFEIEGSESWHLKKLTAHAHPDVLLREYDHGLVLANPSSKPFTFDLAKLLPGQAFRRLQATPLQDTQVNNGQPVGATLTVGPRDGIFLSRE